jgi:hypothetical protein
MIGLSLIEVQQPKANPKIDYHHGAVRLALSVTELSPPAADAPMRR